MCVKLLPRDLNPDPYPPCPTWWSDQGCSYDFSLGGPNYILIC